MKSLILFIAVTISATVYGQWTYKTVSNGFDPTYKIAYCGAGKTYLKLENVDTLMSFYIVGGYTCDENPRVDISFLTSKGNSVYTVIGTTSTSREIVFIVDDMFALPGFIEDFKNAISVKIRVNESYCDTEVFEFKMTGSTAAFNFMSKQ
jgi:hypothetical protein